MHPIHIVNKYLQNKRYSVFFLELRNQKPIISLTDLLDTAGCTNRQTRKAKRSFWKKYLVPNDSNDLIFSPDFMSKIEKDLQHTTKHENWVKHIANEEVSHLQSIQIKEEFTKEDIYRILTSNPTIKFEYPPQNSLQPLDFQKKSIQYSNVTNMSTSTSDPFYISYAFKCHNCKEIIYHPSIIYDSKPVPKTIACKCEKSIKAFLDLEQSISRKVYISEIYNENDETITAIALEKLPQGDIQIATLLCSDLNQYYLIVLCAKPIETKQIDLLFNHDEHKSWQIVKMIDEYHTKTILKKQIIGLDYFKLALIVQKVLNASGLASFNILINTPPGKGKNATMRLHSFTYYKHVKIQPASSLSIPGLRGNVSSFDFGGKKMRYYQSGLMQNHNCSAIDEIFDTPKEVLVQFKNYLSEETMNTTVAGNMRKIPKHCSIVGLSNQKVSAVYNYEMKVKEELEREGIDSNFGVSIYETASDPEVQKIIERVHTKMFINGVNWMDGQDLSFLERFNLIFYISPSHQDKEEKTEEQVKKDYEEGKIINFTEKKFNDLELERILYNSTFDNYLSNCSKGKTLEWDSNHQWKIEQLYRKLKIHITFISETRLTFTLYNLIKALTFIDGRTIPSDEDFEIAEELMKRCFKWTKLENLQKD